MLPIHERFSTWQGEGVHMGRAAFFIRTFGCPLHCPWCDSAGTWHTDYVPPKIERMSERDLVGEALVTNAKIVVITGGEPTIHNLTDLTLQIQSHGLKSHLETSGSFELRGIFDWITLSPKHSKLPRPENVQMADEFKLIIEKPEDVLYWIQLLHKMEAKPTAPIWLHPEWSKRNDPDVLKAISSFVKSLGDPVRAGYQLHKLYKCDALDNRTAPLVPLGGNPALGL